MAIVCLPSILLYSFLSISLAVVVVGVVCCWCCVLLVLVLLVLCSFAYPNRHLLPPPSSPTVATTTGAEPAKGIVQSPKAFGKGIGKGTFSLVKNTVYGVFNTTSNITGSISKGIGALYAFAGSQGVCVC